MESLNQITYLAITLPQLSIEYTKKKKNRKTVISEQSSFTKFLAQVDSQALLIRLTSVVFPICRQTGEPTYIQK